MITLAFYKGRGTTLWQRLQDWGIRFATRSPYSHVELIPGRAEFDQPNTCLSSSGRDGGVRETQITLKRAHWDLVDMPDQPDEIADFIRQRSGARYDYLGIVFSQILSLGRHDSAKWFCSEICAAALGMPNAQRISPQALYDVVTWSAMQMPPDPGPMPVDPPAPKGPGQGVV